jgi:hypothetical protein
MMIAKFKQNVRARGFRSLQSSSRLSQPAIAESATPTCAAGASRIPAPPRRRPLSMIVLIKPSRRTGNRWIVSVVAEEDFVSRTITTESFARHDATDVAAFVRELAARFPAAYFAGF